jgi:heme-degrading monooxygenase HmoA
MFCVLFEVHPKSEQLNSYLDYAKILRPELENVSGFVDNIRYRSLTSNGLILSMSLWQDEKALVRWRTQAKHHDIQEKGREQVFIDYHLRVGEITRDSEIPDDQVSSTQRLDETEVGAGKMVEIITSKLPVNSLNPNIAVELARSLGAPIEADDLIEWDVYDAVLTPGDVLLFMLWRSEKAASAFASQRAVPKDGRYRQIRIIRDYTMRDRREAPQYYPDVAARD